MSKVVPKWAEPIKHNLLGVIPFTCCHFFATVRIEDAIIEALMDTGGACLVIDKQTV